MVFPVIIYNVKNYAKLIFWAHLPRSRYGTNVSGCVRPSSNYSKMTSYTEAHIALSIFRSHPWTVVQLGVSVELGHPGRETSITFRCVMC